MPPFQHKRLVSYGLPLWPTKAVLPINSQESFLSLGNGRMGRGSCKWMLRRVCAVIETTTVQRGSTTEPYDQKQHVPPSKQLSDYTGRQILAHWALSVRFSVTGSWYDSSLKQWRERVLDERTTSGSGYINDMSSYSIEGIARLLALRVFKTGSKTQTCTLSYSILNGVLYLKRWESMMRPYCSSSFLRNCRNSEIAIYDSNNVGSSHWKQAKLCLCSV